MNQTPPFALADAAWLPHRHVEGTDRIQFQYVARADHRSAPFLTDEYLGDARARHDVPVADCLARRAAAYQAWYEHMPVRAATLGLALAVLRAEGMSRAWATD